MDDKLSDKDLISRKELLKELSGFKMMIAGSANAMALMVMEETKRTIVRLIEEQPCAYDPEKVLDELEDYLFDKYCIEGADDVPEIIMKGGTNR